MFIEIMEIVQAHATKKFSLKDQYFDLRGLSEYSSLRIPTLRDYIRQERMPCFKIKGKILVRRNEFDAWLEKFRVKDKIKDIVNEVMGDLKSGESKH